MARVSPNTQLVDDVCHSWFTDSRESENEGMQRTSRSVRSVASFCAFNARSGKSPMAVQRCVRPSTPVTRSVHGRTFTRSPMWGCMCHVQPLSTTKPMLESPGARRREWEAALRRWREAKSTLAGVAGGSAGEM
eukprot:1025493-Pleurochrysis_carterae.AAC.2